MKIRKSNEIAVYIVEDHPLFRQGLREFLSKAKNISVVGEAKNGKEVLHQIKKNPSDVLLLDISLPDQNGLDLIKEIKKRRPKLPILMLSMHPEKRYAMRALKAGASGYLTKSSHPKQILDAVRKVANGENYISSGLAQELVSNIKNSSGKKPHELLTDREFEVMCLLARGNVPSEIAGELCLSLSTIFTHRANILKKMEMKNNSQLMFYANFHGLVEP